MLDIGPPPEPASRVERIGHGGVRVEDLHAADDRDIVEEAAVGADWGQDLPGRTAHRYGSRPRRAREPCGRRRCPDRASRSRRAPRPNPGRTAGGESGGARTSGRRRWRAARPTSAGLGPDLLRHRLGDDHDGIAVRGGVAGYGRVRCVRRIRHFRVERNRQVRRNRPGVVVQISTDASRPFRCRRECGDASRLASASGNSTWIDGERCVSYSTSASASAVRQSMHQWTGFLPR